jgi:hypothetical protein
MEIDGMVMVTHDSQALLHVMYDTNNFNKACTGLIYKKDSRNGF